MHHNSNHHPLAPIKYAISIPNAQLSHFVVNK